MVAFENVTISAGEKTLLRDISFSIDRNEKLVLYGPSGGGKSTLLLALLGACDLTGGNILVEGEALKPPVIARLRRHIAYVGQEPVLGEGTVQEALLRPFSFAANRHLSPSSHDITRQLAQVGLHSTVLTSRCREISGGEKQRIALVRALLLQRPLLVVDEITSALDDQGRDLVWEALFRPDTTLLAVAHDSGSITRFSRRMKIAGGTIVQREGV